MRKKKLYLQSSVISYGNKEKWGRVEGRSLMLFKYVLAKTGELEGSIQSACFHQSWFSHRSRQRRRAATVPGAWASRSGAAVVQRRWGNPRRSPHRN